MEKPDKSKTAGICAGCRDTFAKAGMARHLVACDARPAAVADPADAGLHLAVEAKGDPRYWMHLELRPKTTFRQLDAFLRRAWLECCGHPSAFVVAGERRPGATPAAVASAVAPGDKFDYEYDPAGTLTALSLKVVAVRNAPAGRRVVRVLALNVPPEGTCQRCDQPAAYVDPDDESRLCEGCAADADDEEMLLPLLNSPRAGVCGYCGPSVSLPPAEPVDEVEADED